MLVDWNKTYDELACKLTCNEPVIMSCWQTEHTDNAWESIVCRTWQPTAQPTAQPTNQLRNQLRIQPTNQPCCSGRSKMETRNPTWCKAELDVKRPARWSLRGLASKKDMCFYGGQLKLNSSKVFRKTHVNCETTTTQSTTSVQSTLASPTMLTTKTMVCTLRPNRRWPFLSGSIHCTTLKDQHPN